MPRQQLLKREDRLVVRELPDNAVFVYDEQQRVTHHLSPEIALIWARCDGRNGRSDLERILRLEFSIAEAKSTVRDALVKLSEFNLLKP